MILERRHVKSLRAPRWPLGTIIDCSIYRFVLSDYSSILRFPKKIKEYVKKLLLHFSTKVCPEAIQIPNPALCYNLTQHKTKGFSSILKDWSPYFIWLPVAVLDYGQCFTNIGPTQTDWWRLTRMKPVLIYCRTIREVFTHCVSYIKWSDES